MATLDPMERWREQACEFIETLGFAPKDIPSDGLNIKSDPIRIDTVVYDEEGQLQFDTAYRSVREPHYILRKDLTVEQLAMLRRLGARNVTRFDDIRQRLDAVSDVEWDEADYPSEELYGDFLRIGPFYMRVTRTDIDPEKYYRPAPPERIAELVEEGREAAAKEKIVAEFLRNAVSDLQTLLDAIEHSGSGEIADAAE